MQRFGRQVVVASTLSVLALVCTRAGASPCGAGVVVVGRGLLPTGAIPPGLSEPPDPRAPDPTPTDPPPPEAPQPTTTPEDAPPPTPTTPTPTPTAPTPSEPEDAPPASTPTTPAPAAPPPKPVTAPPPSTNPPPAPQAPTGYESDAGARSGRRTAGRDEAAWEVWWAVHRLEFLRPADHALERTGDVSAPVSPATRIRVRERLLKLWRTSQDINVRGAALSAAVRLSTPEEAATMGDLVGGALREHNVLLGMAVGNALSYSSAVALVPTVHPIAKDENVEAHVRGLVALAMPSLWADHADAQLVQMLTADRGREPAFEEAILTAMGTTHDPVGTAALERVVKDLEQSPTLRATALASLARRGLASAPTLLAALVDRRVEVRRAAATGLGLLPWAAAKEAAEPQALRKAADADAAPLDDALLEKMSVERSAALHTTERNVCVRLGRVLLNERDKSVRAAAALSLARIAKVTGSTVPGNVLLADLARGNDVREYEMLALAIAGDPRVLPTCFKALRSSTTAPTTRAAAAVALGLFGDRAAAPALRAVLTDDTNPQVRGHAAVSLAMIRDGASTALIRQGFLTTRDDESRGQFGIALGLFGRAPHAGALAERLTRGGSPRLGWSLAEALRLAGQPAPWSVLLDAAEDPLCDSAADCIRATAGILAPNDGGKTERVRAFDHIHGEDFLLAYVLFP